MIADLAGDLLNGGIPKGSGRDVRSNGDFFPLPERVSLRKGLLPEYIEGCSQQGTVVQGPKQVVLNQVFTPANVDQHGTRLELAQQIIVDDVPGFVGQGQCVDQNTGGLQKVAQLVLAVVG